MCNASTSLFMSRMPEVSRRMAVSLGGAALLAAAARSVRAAPGVRGIIAVDKMGEHVRFYDPTTFAETGRIATPKAPHELALHPDGRHAFVSIYGAGIFGNNPKPGHEILVLDLERRTEVGRLSVDPYRPPHGMQFDADNKLWVTCDLAGCLLQLDPANGTLLKEIETGSLGGHWLCLSHDKRKVYVSNKGAPLGVFDVESGRPLATVSLPRGSEGLDATADGRIVIADNETGSLHEIEIVTDRVLRTTPLHDSPPTNPKRSRLVRVRVSPDGRHVLTGNYASAVVYVHDAMDLADQTLLVVAKGPMGFAFAPDNRTALVANHDSGLVTLLDMESRRVLGAFEAGSGVETLSYY